MKNDWRWAVCILAFLTIPAGGAWHYAQHREIMNHEKQLQASVLPCCVSNKLQRLELSGFLVEEGASVVSSGDIEYACVESSDLSCGVPVVIVLKRYKKPESSLTCEMSTGIVKGLVSRKQTISRTRAERMGLVVPEYAPDHLFVVDVDREYLARLLD